MDIATSFSKMISSTLEKIRRNNKLIESERKKTNPTFLEIIECLKTEDETLAYLLLKWYFKKYEDTDIMESDNAIDDFLKQQTNSKKQCNDYVTCGCGFDEDEDDYVRSCMGASC